MSFLKKEGQRVWVPEVISKIWVPGRWEEKKVTESVYVSDSGNSGGSTGGDRYVDVDFGLGWGNDFSDLIVDY